MSSPNITSIVIDNVENQEEQIFIVTYNVILSNKYIVKIRTNIIKPDYQDDLSMDGGGQPLINLNDLKYIYNYCYLEGIINFQDNKIIVDSAAVDRAATGILLEISAEYINEKNIEDGLSPLLAAAKI